MSEGNTTFTGERIRALREALGVKLGRKAAVSHADLAAALCVDRLTLIRYENEQRKPTLAVCRMLTLLEQADDAVLAFIHRVMGGDAGTMPVLNGERFAAARRRLGWSLEVASRNLGTTIYEIRKVERTGFVPAALLEAIEREAKGGIGR